MRTHLSAILLLAFSWLIAPLQAIAQQQPTAPPPELLLAWSTAHDGGLGNVSDDASIP